MTITSSADLTGADPGDDDDPDEQRPEHDSKNPALEDDPDPDEPST